MWKQVGKQRWAWRIQQEGCSGSPRGTLHAGGMSEAAGLGASPHRTQPKPIIEP